MLGGCILSGQRNLEKSILLKEGVYPHMKQGMLVHVMYTWRGITRLRGLGIDELSACEVWDEV